jgi:hypothetical protein
MIRRGRRARTVGPPSRHPLTAQLLPHTSRLDSGFSDFAATRRGQVTRLTDPDSHRSWNRRGATENWTDIRKKWAHLGSNQGLLACKARSWCPGWCLTCCSFRTDAGWGRGGAAWLLQTSATDPGRARTWPSLRSARAESSSRLAGPGSALAPASDAPKVRPCRRSCEASRSGARGIAPFCNAARHC